MNDSFITILTGPTQSGKTTYLLKKYSGKKNVYGILTPIVEGKRMFLDIATGKVFSMEASAEDEDVLPVGKYRFSKNFFDRAITVLKEGLQQKKGILILDEIGPLELRNEGFNKEIREIVADKKTQQKKIIVVREAILQNVTNFFGIENYQIVRPPPI